MNVSLLILAAHMLGDFVFQTQWVADRKLKSAWVRLLHVWTYTACFLPIVGLASLSLRQAVAFLLLVFITHFITDSRRWASSDLWELKPLMVDQTIHITTLAILAAAFGM